jgi:hypothetical protein
MRTHPLLRRRRLGVIGGGILLLVAAIGLVPGSAQAELDAGDRALKAAVSHQATVDAAMALFLSPSDPNQSQAPEAIRAESDRRLSLYRDAIAEVSSDSAQLKQAAEVLGWLEPVALGKIGEVQRARRQAQATLLRLGQAEAVLTAAVDQELVGRGIFEATLKENDMLDAMRAQQYVAADRLDAQADKDLLAAESRVLKPDEPPDMRYLVGSVRSMIDATDTLVMDRLRQDAKDQQLRENELKQAIWDFTRFSTEQRLAANRSWNEMTYRPRVAGYDTALSRM